MPKRNKDVGIILFEDIHGKHNVASSRIAGHWLVKYWPEAEIFHYATKYDTVIFQKAYLYDYAKTYDGIKILYVCDPDWATGENIKEFIELMDGIVVPTEEMANFFKSITDKPVKVIPDRIDLEFYKEKKIHKGQAKEIVWHGYSHNAHTLKAAKYAIKRNNLRLSIISDTPVTINSDSEDDKIDERWTKWDLNTFAKDFIKSDICIMPGSTKPNDRFKSNNKTTLSWALGIPVATTAEELEKFINEEERIKESELRLKEVRENYDIKQSVKEIQDFIEEIKRSKV